MTLQERVAQVTELLRGFGFTPEVGGEQLTLDGRTTVQVHIQVGEVNLSLDIEDQDPEVAASLLLHDLAYHDDLDLDDWEVTPEAGTVLGRAAADDGDVEDYAVGYAEPGYTDPEDGRFIWFANWNPPKLTCLSEILERGGHKIEWSDEWVRCDDCQLAIRIQPDSYSWTRSYYHFKEAGELICAACIRRDPEAFLEDIRGNPRQADTMDILGSDAAPGIVRANKDRFESGLYGGQCDDPELIGKILRRAGVEDFWFTIDSVGQFDTDFSVWVREEDLDRARTAIECGNTQGVDPAEIMKAGFESMAHMPAPPGEGGVVVTKLTPDGKAVGKRVSNEDFIAGRVLDWDPADADVQSK